MNDSPLNPIRAFRKGQQPPMSLKVLAERVGVTTATMSRVESGKMPLSVPLAKRIAENTGIPLAKLCPDLAEMFQGAAPAPAEAAQ